MEFTSPQTLSKKLSSHLFDQNADRHYLCTDIQRAATLTAKARLLKIVCLVFGPETRWLACGRFYRAFTTSSRRLRLRCKPALRSLNLSNTVAVMFRILRQLNLPPMPSDSE